MNLVPFYNILTTALPTKSIFIFNMPDQTVEGILLLHNLNGARLDSDLPDYKKAKFQAIVRSTDFETGYALSLSVMSVFKGILRTTQDGVLIHFITPINDPVAFPVSLGDFIEFSVNFETVYVEHN